MSDTQTGDRGVSTAEPEEEATCASAGERDMPCPMCGSSMPDLKGGKASICPNCGFKDSCCF